MPETEVAGSLEWRWSGEVEDPAWDAFLLDTPLGQFQQSSRWARAKRCEGWSPIRLRLEQHGAVVAGFQILWKRRALGRIGYISKGPVVPPGRPGLALPALQGLERAMRQHRISALLIQPPDLDRALTPLLREAGGVPDVPGRVVEATLTNDLSRGVDAINAGLSSNTRNELRQAAKRGLLVREGSRADLSAFFDLMQETCKRQKSHPNPSSVAALEALWDAFSPAFCRLFLAEWQGAPIAGLLCIGFGPVFTLWKKGWNGTHRDKRPNELLTHAALVQGARTGYQVADFAALQMDIARALVNGKPLTEAQRGTRHFFNLRFGGQARILPPAQVLIRNRLIRGVARRVSTLRPPAMHTGSR